MERKPFQQVTDFQEEVEVVYAVLQSLKDDDFERHTQFKSWTITDIIRHLHVWNVGADMSLASDPGFSGFIEGALDAFQSTGLCRYEAEWLGDINGQALADLWYDFSQEMIARFGAADPNHRVCWAGPDMSVRSSITARLMETWSHSQAMFDIFGLEREEGDRIRNIVFLGISTFEWTFRNRGHNVPGEMPHIELTSPSGEVWNSNEHVTTDHITGSALGFSQTVTQVRNVADTDLRVRGDIARQWMMHAQCFAGPPTNPPPAGARFKSTA